MTAIVTDMGATMTLSDLNTRTMTPDQINTEALLQSRDYFNITSGTESGSDMAATGGTLRLGQSGEGVRRSGDQYGGLGHSGEALRRSGDQYGGLGQSGQGARLPADQYGGLGRSGEVVRRSGDQYGVLGESGEALRRSADQYGGQMMTTMGSTSDMSLPSGLTETLQRNDDPRDSDRATYTLDPDSDLRLSRNNQDYLQVR